jgi:hypothetical protein
MGTINDADPVTGQWTDNAGQTRDRDGRVISNADGSAPKGNGFKTPFGNWRPGNPTADSASKVAQREALFGQGQAAGNFAGVGEAGYGAMSAEAAQQREMLRRQALGQDSLSAEQLRQGLQQNMSAQRSMAASASPSNGPMAALHAAQNMGRQGAGMSGQAALAGIQERAAAQQNLGQSISAQRGQDLQAALGSRQTAVSGFGGVTPEKSTLEKWGDPIASGLGAYAKFSDKRLKEDIEDGDKDANAAIEGLQSYTYKYKDKKLGKDRELGVMAQDLEKAGLKHAVFETPRGKAVHGAALSTANTSMIAALGKRVRELEGKKG